MEARHLVAYGLIVLLVAAAIGLFFYLRYHSRENTLRRHQLRMRERARRKGRSEPPDKA